MAMADSWSIGLSIAAQNDPATGDLYAWLQSLDGIARSSFNSGTGSWGQLASSSTVLNTLRAYKYESGQKKSSAIAEYPLSAAVNGAGGAASPTLLSCVASLKTAQAGRSGRGRSYCPADGAALTGHQFSSDDCDKISYGMVQLIEGINASTLKGGEVQVVIGGLVYPYPPVVEVRVDSLPDVQHRRAGKEGATVTSVRSVVT